MGYKFRTDGPWGPGLGRDLASTEVDSNFWQAIQDIAAKAVQGVGISNMVVAGNQLTVVLTDHTLLGPYDLPIAEIAFKGEWLPDAAYHANDIITHAGSTYIVLINHTSASTFDPGANDGMAHDYYGLLLQNPAMVVPSGGAAGQVLTKATTADWSMLWQWPMLGDLHDVQQSPGPLAGDLVYWTGGRFGYLPQSSIVGAVPNLADLADVLASPTPSAGDVVTWNGSAFTYAPPTVSTTLAGLSDVLASPAAVTGQLVYWNGSAFTYKTPSSTMLTDFGVGTYTAVQNSDVFSYDTATAKWVNRSLVSYQDWSSTPRTLASGDAWNILNYNGGSTPATVTVPPNATVAFGLGTFIWVRQGATGQITIAPGSGVTVVAPTGRLPKTRTIGSELVLQKASTDYWILTGDLDYDSTTNVFPTTGSFNLDPTGSDSDTCIWHPAGNQTVNLVSGSAHFGKRLIVVITTSGTSSYTLTFGTGFKTTGTLATGTVSGKVFVISFIGDGVNFNEVSRTTAM